MTTPLNRILRLSTLAVGALLLGAHAALFGQGKPQVTAPEGFRVTVFAQDLEGLRGIAVSPEGKVYGRVRGRGIVALADRNGDDVADQVETVPGSIAEGSGVGIYDGYLYYSSNSAVYRRALRSGELMPSADRETIVSGLGDRGQHNSKMFAFDEAGHLYVEVGAPSNALGEPDRAPGAEGLSEEAVQAYLESWGGIWRFDADRTGQTQADGLRFSTGSRHILSFFWHPEAEAIFAVQNGRDVLNVVDPTFSVEYNAERVAEEMHVIRQGANLGWPYTYYDPLANVRLMSPEYGGDGEKRPEPGTYQEPTIAFPAHWAPMQMAHYPGGAFPERYHGGAFVAFHGSWNRSPVQKGFNVCFIPVGEDHLPTGAWEVFADGFVGKERISSPAEADYRPMGVAVGPDGALYIGSDHGGRVWKVTYRGR